MKIFFLRLFFILLLVFFEFSFFDVLFPRVAVPIVLVVSIVVWALIVDFPRVLYTVIPLAAFFDIISSGMVGALTLYAILITYATSFLSRRLLIEHRVAGMFLYALFAFGGSIGYVIFHFLFFRGGISLWSSESFSGLFSILASSEFFLLIFLSLFLFPALRWIIRRFEFFMNIEAQRGIPMR